MSADPTGDALAALEEVWPNLTIDTLRDGVIVAAVAGNLDDDHGDPTIELVWQEGDEEDPALCWGVLDHNDGAARLGSAVDAMRAAMRYEADMLEMGVVNLRRLAAVRDSAAFDGDDRDDLAAKNTELMAEVERLTAQVRELEAPGECQSLHKLRARVQELTDERAASIAATRRDMRTTIAADLRRYAGQIEAVQRDSNTQRAIANARARMVWSLADKIERCDVIAKVEVSDG